MKKLLIFIFAISVILSSCSGESGETENVENENIVSEENAENEEAQIPEVTYDQLSYNIETEERYETLYCIFTYKNESSRPVLNYNVEFKTTDTNKIISFYSAETVMPNETSAVVEVSNASEPENMKPISFSYEILTDRNTKMRIKYDVKLELYEVYEF